METPEITYLVLNYNPNGSEHITPKYVNCLETFYRNVDHSIKKEVIVLDQGSPDEVLRQTEQMQKLYGFTHVVLGRNVGISAGVNLGFQMGRGKVLALLTYDVLVTRGFDRSCLTELAKDPSIYTMTVLSDVGDNPHQTLGTGKPFGTDEVLVPGGVADAGLVELTLNFYTRECIKRVGYFDERWMACYENMDYVWRIMLAGGRAVINRGAFAWHYHNTASRYVGRNHFYEGCYQGDPFADGRINKLWLDKWGTDINKDTRFDSWQLPARAVIDKYRASHGSSIYLGWPQERPYK